MDAHALLEEAAGWVGSVELAERHGLPYRPLAFQLRQMVRDGLASERMVAVKGKSRSKELKREYHIGQVGEHSQPLAARDELQRQHCGHADRAALLLLHAVGDWVSSTALAARAGLRYRPLAFACRRLARETALVEERIVTCRGSARSKEERREYRLTTTMASNPLFPPVLPVPPEAPRRRVVGMNLCG